MKRVDDKKIINTVKQNENYKIKTTSHDILLALKKEQALDEKRKKAKKRNGIIFGSLGGLVLVGACSIALLFTFKTTTKKDNIENVINIYSPSTNDNLKTQLVTFASFQTEQNNQLNLKNKRNKNLINSNNIEVFNKNDDDEDNEDNILNEEILNEIANLYENVQYGVKEIFSLNNIEIISSKEEFTYNGITYKNKDLFKDKNTQEVIATLYYKDIIVEKDDDETMTSYDGLYKLQDEYYHTSLIEEKEEDEDEKEIELRAIFKNVNKDLDSKIYVVEKEHEFKGNKSENSYSYITYLSEKDLKEDEYISKITYKSENSKLEINFEDKINNLEIEFNNINKMDNNSFTFDIEYENNEVSGNYFIKVTYNSNNTRTYYCHEYEVIKP